jgi:hypothetical protein
MQRQVAMENFETLGKWLVAVGGILVVLGIILWLLGRFVNLESLPGTLRIQGSGFTCVVPLLASIVGSLVLTILLNLVVRFFRK